MKFKPLLLLVAATGLLASCGANEPSTTTSSQASSSTSQEAAPTYLTFVEKGKFRIDLFDVDVNFSYGNTALSAAVNTVSFAPDSYITVNKNSEIQNYHIVMFAEKGNRHTIKYLSPYGQDLVEFVEMGSFKNFYKDFVDGGRGYLAISTGEAARWTKGLNAAFDAEVESWTTIK